MEGSDVGQDMRFNFYCLLSFEILCNFRYFSIEDFIFLILGVFKDFFFFFFFLAKLGSYYGRCQLRSLLEYFYLKNKFFGALK